MSLGVIVGCDTAQQSLLSFWWLNYRLHNNFPVTFMDFGMNEEGKKWCRERGNLISIKKTLLKASSLCENKKHEHLDSYHKTRISWFKKPLACLASPYETTIWLDTDCVVRGNLSKAFNLCENELGICIAKEPEAGKMHLFSKGYINKDSTLYNSGVIVFKKNAPILYKWKEIAEKKEFRGDQEALSFVLNQEKGEHSSLPYEFNWMHTIDHNVNKEAIVHHLLGPEMKEILHIMIAAIESFFYQKITH